MPRISCVLRWITAATFATVCLRAIAAITDVSLGQLSFTTTTFSVSAGLPSNVAQALVQTRDGYLWIGTEGGLARFDGVRFTIYRVAEVPELTDNLIRCLLEDRDGCLWIGTQKGLARYRGGRFERVAGIATAVAALTQSPNGSVWVGTVRGGLWEWRDGRLQQRADGTLMQPTDSPMRAFADSTGRVWTAINRGRLLCVEDGVLRIPRGPVADFKQINRMAETPGGTLWFATEGGLFRVRGTEVRAFGKAAGIGEDLITDLMVDRAGRLWVAGRALWVAENPENDSFTRVSVPQVEYPRYLIQDREGTYWIGTSGDGLARMRPSAFRFLAHVQDIALRRARSVTVDQSGCAWAALGDERHRLVRIGPDDSIDFIDVGRGPDADVVSVLAATDGSVWFGSRGALGVWRAGQVRRFPAMADARVLYQARDGVMWYGVGGGGVWRRRGDGFEPVAVPAAFQRETPTVIAEGAPGVVYIGYLSAGILKLTEAGAEPITMQTGLPSNEIRAIHVDAEGRLWVGFRRDGLALYADGRWLSPEGFGQPFGERVCAINEDDLGNLWLGTVRGVVWAQKEEFVAVAHGASAVGRFHVAGLSEGFGGGVVGTGAQPTMWKTRDGTMWFASRDGLALAHPSSMPVNTVPPPVRIETVSVDGRVSAVPATLRLGAGVRSLMIDYTALSFVQPQRVQFRYQLVGHDREWVQAGTRRTAFYSHLQPGRYQFRVVASNEDGVWNEHGAGFAIVQLPAFYQTWWFYALVVVVALGGGLGLYYWRTAGLRRLVAQQTLQIRGQLEKETELRAELERSARLESLGVLAGGIAHDFNNLLTVIIANLGLAASDRRVREAAGEQIDAAERGATRAAELTQQLLTFARGGDPVRRAVALPDVVREAAEFARHGSQVRCDLVVEPNLPPANVDRAQIGRVIHNLVINATQAMSAGGVITIRLASVDVARGEYPALAPGRYVKISIADQGVGIPPEHLAHIFEPYFSTKPRNHGLGLATVHSIVKKHQGHVSVDSQVGRGTTFQVLLPVAADEPEVVVPAVVAEPKKPVRLRVLFMDDEEVIRVVATGILRHLGHEAMVVADGAEAVRAYEQAFRGGNHFHVVVLDLTVPGGMGGREAFEAMRRIDPDVRAIVSSGYSSDPVLARYREYGFKAVVPKPYQLEDLARAVQQVANPRHGDSP